MHHGQRLVLLVYLHLTLEIQYNTILIIINSIYIILLFANKQWGVTIALSETWNIGTFSISFTKSTMLVVAICGRGYNKSPLTLNLQIKIMLSLV